MGVKVRNESLRIKVRKELINPNTGKRKSISVGKKTKYGVSTDVQRLELLRI